jgi:hypothetical protein
MHPRDRSIERGGPDHGPGLQTDYSPSAAPSPAATNLASSQTETAMSDTDRIRMLNDELRQHLLGGGAVMTPGIAALGSEAVKRLVQTIDV